MAIAFPLIHYLYSSLASTWDLWSHWGHSWILVSCWLIEMALNRGLIKIDFNWFFNQLGLGTSIEMQRSFLFFKKRSLIKILVQIYVYLQSFCSKDKDSRHQKQETTNTKNWWKVLEDLNVQVCVVCSRILPRVSKQRISLEFCLWPPCFLPFRSSRKHGWL